MPHPESNPTHVTIVICEDEADLAELYASWLEEIATETGSEREPGSEPYKVRTVYDGDELLAAVDETVDVVVLNRRLPGVSGDQALAKIREQGLTCGVVIVSGVTPNFDLIDMAFDAYLVKPVDASELRDAVSRVRAYAANDDDLRELQQLQATASALEEVTRDATLQASDEYTALQERITALQAATDSSDTTTATTATPDSAPMDDNPESDPSDPDASDEESS